MEEVKRYIYRPQSKEGKEEEYEPCDNTVQIPALFLTEERRKMIDTSLFKGKEEKKSQRSQPSVIGRKGGWPSYTVGRWKKEKKKEGAAFSLHHHAGGGKIEKFFHNFFFMYRGGEREGRGKQAFNFSKSPFQEGGGKRRGN